MTRQKNKFLTFIFSLMPGCGQMFLGFMRRGLCFMLCFWGSLIFVEGLNIWFFVIPMIISWFCAFFDAINLNTMPPEQFAERTDAFLIPGFSGNIVPRRIARWIGIAMLSTGLYLIWDHAWTVIHNIMYELELEFYPFVYYIYNAIPLILVSIVVIVLGIKLIIGKKKALENVIGSETE